jgi:antitoxin VapB
MVESRQEFRMTMTIPTEVEQLARLVAVKTGKTPDAILREAVEARARAAGVAPPPIQRAFDDARVKAIIARVSGLPLLDERSADDIIGYDEFGVPQ